MKQTPGRIALVTGGGSGIGQQAALALANEGFSVVVCGRQAATLRQTADLIRKAGGTVLAVTCDVGHASSVTRLFGRIEAKFGRLDVLFNNAGTFGRPRRLEDIDPKDWEAVVRTNLTGAFLCTREAFRLMKRQTPRGGRIINNGSISAHTPRPDSVAYTATKHAITGLTKSTALDGRRYDIACGQIDIGNTATQMTERMERGMMQADGNIRPEPTFDVTHVGRAVVYMATLPLDTNVQFLTIMATKMPYIGRG